MVTLNIEVEDSFLQEFFNFINKHKDKIVTIDEKLKEDTYFYERQKELQKRVDEINSGKSTLVSLNDFKKSMNKFEKELEIKYANQT